MVSERERDSQGSGRPAPSGARSLLDSPVRRSIVDLLSGLPAPIDAPAPGLSAGDLADRLELHVTTVRFHLDQLVAGGLLDSEFRGGRVGRPRKVYRIRPGGLLTDSSVDAFAALTEVLTDAWPAPGEVALSPIEAGRRWMLRHAKPPSPSADSDGSAATWFGRVGHVVDLLERWGYRPDLRTSDGGNVVEMTLVDCPFITMAATRADVVCGVHQGLIQGALESTGETDVEVRLLPLITPRTCAAHLRRVAQAEPTHLPSTPAAVDEKESS